jgi:hypothetical protein
MLNSFWSVTHGTLPSNFVTFALLHAERSDSKKSPSFDIDDGNRRLGLKEDSSSMSAGDDCLTSDVLRGVVQAGEENRLGSKLAEVAPGITSS